MAGRFGILCLIAFAHMLGSKLVEGTISSMEGDNGNFTVECVDIYKQPAFSHPLLKNHTIQMRPTSIPNGFQEIISWKGYEKCPQGTIPILKSQLFKKNKTSGFISNKINPTQLPSKDHEYAQVSVFDGPYYGAHASLNVWKPYVANPGEFSISQIWVIAGIDATLNSIEVGWQAFPGSDAPRIFIYWTRNNYQGTGCYNLECPGFIQTNRRVILGENITPFSTYNGKQFQIEVAIHKDKISGNWWLRLGNEDVGYWPKSILTTLAESSEAINWGGEIVNLNLDGKHTSTHMGSGHFSNEKYGKAAYIGNIGYFDSNGGLIVPTKMEQYITNAACYDLQFGPRGSGLALHFYFGGPGFSPRCP